MRMVLLLMAAGKGSRYGKLKQFDSFGPAGEFLMEFSIYDALENGFTHFVVITQKDNVEFLEAYLRKRLPEGTKLDVLPQQLEDLPEGVGFQGERSKPWGTAHAVWTARHIIHTPFAVINADDYYGKQAYHRASEFIRNADGSAKYGLVAYTLRDTLSPHGSVSRGVCQQDGDKLLSVEERTKLLPQNDKVVDLDSGLTFSGNELVSMNFWVCHPSLFSRIEKDLSRFIQNAPNPESGEVYLPFVIQGLLGDQEAQVKVIPANSHWFGVTYSEDKERASEELARMTQEGQYRTPLWPGSNLN